MRKSKKRQTSHLQTLLANVFTRISYKINFSNKKGNQSLLAIDILKDEVQKDLLHLVNHNLEKTYRELISQKSPHPEMQNNGERIFSKLVQETCDDFLVKHYGCDARLNSSTFTNSLYVKELMQDVKILFQVPFYAFLNPKSPDFLSFYYPIYSYASENFLEALIDNLVIEVANCIVYYIIINFSFLYSFRQLLYRSQFLALRNFERFKNNLIWRLRLQVYIQRPTAFYSSYYKLFILRTNGICSRIVYANRPQYFGSLTNFPLFIVSLIELKDFILSRFDELLYFLSKGLRFTLTSVIGQFVGLVWRGIIEGLKK